MREGKEEEDKEIRAREMKDGEKSIRNEKKEGGWRERENKV